MTPDNIVNDPTAGTRPSGEAYIDDPLQSPALSSTSGSSISEELAIDHFELYPAVNGMRDYDVLDNLRARQSYSDGVEDPCEDMEDDVETEDWELADGDFTKQYNRMRQHYEVVSSAGPSRAQKPIPARNTTPSLRATSRISGVSGNPKANNERTHQDKSQRATTEQVLDPRTLLVLSGLINRGICGKLQQCISTGKEANVYYAPTEAPDTAGQTAVKIYRTSILNFRSRQAYIEGEFRFRGEYSSSRNPRKMVRLWAEKELRNLRRLQQEGIPAPRAIEVKENVLVLEYLGTGQHAAPRLKDADLAGDILEKAYKALLITMRRMFQSCKLVHADLSEYNVLYFQDEPYIIDVSQSVEQDHPRAYEFLRSDIKNVENFFRRQSGGCRTLGVRGAWTFITDPDLGIDDAGDRNSTLALTVSLEGRLQEPVSPSLDAVFLNSFMPRGLGDIPDPERHIDEASQTPTLAISEPQSNEIRDSSDAEDLSATSSDESGGSQQQPIVSKSRGFRHEDRDIKRARKKAVKEENRERRKQKMPKAEKARLINKTAR